MGRLTGLQFSRSEFIEAIAVAIETHYDEPYDQKLAKHVLSDLEDTFEGLVDIFENDDEEEEDSGDVEDPYEEDE